MKNYIEKAIKTESKDFGKISNRLQDESMIRLSHAGVGLVTESAEFLDALKKAIYYGKELDKVNLTEEIGDILWYCAIALDEVGASFEEVMEKNIAKLEARYPEKFTEEKAENRDLEVERGILEK
jgi:NTP pyrophosphatase (non-canonical NTP hydrolase)